MAKRLKEAERKKRTDNGNEVQLRCVNLCKDCTKSELARDMSHIMVWPVLYVHCVTAYNLFKTHVAKETGISQFFVF